MSIAERWKGFRELPSDIEEAVVRLVPLFEQEGVLLAYLFGSLAKGREAHDVDLAILVQGRAAYRLRAKISECLGTERLHLVDLSRTSPLLRFGQVCTGDHHLDEVRSEGRGGRLLPNGLVEKRRRWI